MREPCRHQYIDASGHKAPMLAPTPTWRASVQHLPLFSPIYTRSSPVVLLPLQDRHWIRAFPTSATVPLLHRVSSAVHYQIQDLTPARLSQTPIRLHLLYTNYTLRGPGSVWAGPEPLTIPTTHPGRETRNQRIQTTSVRAIQGDPRRKYTQYGERVRMAQ